MATTPGRGMGPGWAGGQVGIDEDRPELFVSAAGIEVGQAAETVAIVLDVGIAMQQLSAGLAPVAVRHRQQRRQIKAGEVGGEQRIDRRLRQQGDPEPAPIGVETGSLQPTLLQELGIGWIHGVAHPPALMKR